MTAAGNHGLARPRWLCIAYSFPPINRSGTHRTLAFVRHLASHGWDASVLTVEASGGPVDERLESLVPPTVDVVRTRCPNLVETVKQYTGIRRWRRRGRTGITASGTIDHRMPGEQSQTRGLREWVSRFLQTPDPRLGWYSPGRRAGQEILRSRPHDVIYSTSPCMTAHLLARRLSRSYGIPWVADFRDPWGDNPYRDSPFKSLAWWDGHLERRVLHDADHIVCNTVTMRECLCDRLPFVGGKSSVIMNGYDAERMEDLKPVRLAPASEFLITHAGQFYGPRSPVPMFRALRQEMQGRHEADRRIRLVLVGSERCDGVPLVEHARREGVESHVTILGPGRHREALALLAGSDGVLLMGSTGPGRNLQVPNKLFEYLSLQRPILAAVPADHPSLEILREANADYVAGPPEDPGALASALHRFADEKRTVPPDAWSGTSRFDRNDRAMELLAVFERVTGRFTRSEVVAEAAASRNSHTQRSNASVSPDHEPLTTPA